MRFFCLALCLVLSVVATEDSVVRFKRSPLLGNLLGGNIPLIGGLLGGGGGNVPKPTTTTPKPTTAGKSTLLTVKQDWQDFGAVPSPSSPPTGVT
ncbi:hypothetical protein AAVH_20346 [Aphelenchoides avenae]|nr:hypothetical protein AAVH_20346 [Aphelenchus avenae]